MSSGAEWRLRSFLMALLGVASATSFLLAGGLLLLWRLPQLQVDTHAVLQGEGMALAARAEEQLHARQAQLGLLALMHSRSPASVSREMLQRAVDEGGFSALYLVETTGRVRLAAVSARLGAARGQELIGNDLSADPLLGRVSNEQQAVWGDKYVSPVSNRIAVGIAMPAGDAVLIGEVALEQVFHWADGLPGQYGLWIVDSRGELLADSENPARVGVVSLASQALFRQALTQAPALGGLVFEGSEFDAAVVRSARLNWYFVARSPGGWRNPRIRAAFEFAFIALGISLALTLLLAPGWATRMARPISQISLRAQALARGEAVAPWPRSGIAEIDELSGGLAQMAQAVKQREQELRELNQQLEARVAQRTGELAQANTELSASVERLQMAQEELVRAEKLASLGTLVAGLAHELNTPVGNGLLASSTLRDSAQTFREQLARGARRSELDAFLEAVDSGADIAQRNLQRAAELVSSFKQVAADQVSSQQRRFALDEMVAEVCLTLRPLLRKHGVALEIDVPGGIEMESFPGPLGQVLTNLIVNAVLHAFGGRPGGLITISARLADARGLQIEVTDDGAGISADLLPRIFDPFVTTRLGSGGTGLGLHIVHNIVSQVLRGRVSVRSAPGEGSTFTLTLPQRLAPEA